MPMAATPAAEPIIKTLPAEDPHKQGRGCFIYLDKIFGGDYYVAKDKCKN